ncbi:group 3 secretory phospholipase A2 [Colossoma macropomum]|uniref:group 3 secretory phospholipase A2 n=1 Tax=Colossoma macropomum TaxID=42526 RepID=UPI0018641857|nr:group 3 secretory phospholipase A2 [Colossoma macropomum]
MNGRCLFQAVVCLMSFFLDFSAAGHFWTFAGSSTFCFWTKSISNGRTHYMFLHQTGEANERSLVLFDSIWNKENSLVDCITSSDQAVTKSYESKCWEAGGRPFLETPDGRFNISELVEPDGPCVAMGRLAGLRTSVRRSRDLESVNRKAASMRQNSGESSGLKQRRTKRAWMIPGTLWCGAGNKALNFSDLGMYEETDKCCREHDHCKDAIASFGFNYGVFNTNIFTLSHCDCDTKFRRCLHKANDSMSNVVGYGYFNILKMRCFEFSQKMQCVERTWWGMCKLYQLTKYALVKDATYYNSTSPELEDDMQGLAIYHTISAGNHTFTTSSAMSSTVLMEDARTASTEQSTVSGAELTSSTANAPELHEGSPQTNSPLTETTLPQTTQNKTTDPPHTQRTDSPHTPTKDSPRTPTTVSPQTKTTDSPHTPTKDSPRTPTTVSPQTKTTDSPHTPTKDSPKTPTTVSPQTKTTDSPHTPTKDSPKTPTVSLQTQRTDSPQTKTTDSPHVPTKESPRTPTTGSPQTYSPQTHSGVPMTKTTDAPHTPTNDSPRTPITVSPQTQRTDTPQTKTTGSPKTHLQPDLHTRQKDKLETCESYKDLDSCRHQIPAMQEKYGLRNSEFTTLYHCNCTARLAREFAGQDKADDVHFLLLDFVSQFCFILPLNCTHESCSISSTEAPLLKRWSKDVAGWRPLVASKRKAKRFNSKRSKRKDSTFRLYKKCLRMHSKLQKHNAPKEKLQDHGGAASQRQTLQYALN